MVDYPVRGEAANHGIIDTSVLIKLLLGQNEYVPSNADMKQIVDTYEEEMISRTYPAVLKSRQVCIDANNFASVKYESPLIGRRVMKD